MNFNGSPARRPCHRLYKVSRVHEGTRMGGGKKKRKKNGGWKEEDEVGKQREQAGDSRIMCKFM